MIVLHCLRQVLGNGSILPYMPYMPSSTIVEDSVFDFFDLSACADTLPNDAKQRYLEKLASIEIDGPYSIDDNYWLRDENAIKILPDFSYVDLLTYIMNSKSAFTKENLKAYKSLDAYQRLNNKLFGSYDGLQLKNNVTVFRGKVGHSMAVLQNPLHPWVALANSGSVLCAHCTCPAG